jgi:hypothetical protein
MTHGKYDMDVWTIKDVIWWAYECEQVSMKKSFLEYFVNVERIFLKYYLTHGIKYLMTWKNIMPHVHRWMTFMDEK